MNIPRQSPSFLDEEKIDDAFLSYAADVLASYHGSKEWAARFSKLAIQQNVTIPYPMGPAANKHTLIYENLRAFQGADQFAFIEDATSEVHVLHRAEAKELRQTLLEKYAASFGQTEDQGISQPLVEETKHWLNEYPDSLRLYLDAEEKYHSGRYTRNLLDDLRLALELLLRRLLRNSKSLENQIPELGRLLAAQSSSKEFRNMFQKLIEYFCDYQNTYIKHNDRPDHMEVEAVFDLTSSFLKHLIRITADDSDANP